MRTEKRVKRAMMNKAVYLLRVQGVIATQLRLCRQNCIDDLEKKQSWPKCQTQANHYQALLFSEVFTLQRLLRCKRRTGSAPNDVRNACNRCTSGCAQVIKIHFKCDAPWYATKNVCLTPIQIRFWNAAKKRHHKHCKAVLQNVQMCRSRNSNNQKNPPLETWRTWTRFLRT